MSMMSISLPSEAVENFVRIPGEEPLGAQADFDDVPTEKELADSQVRYFENDIKDARRCASEVQEVLRVVNTKLDRSQSQSSETAQLRDKLELASHENHTLLTYVIELENDLRDIRTKTQMNNAFGEASRNENSEELRIHATHIEKLRSAKSLQVACLRSKWNMTLHHRLSALHNALEIVNSCPSTLPADWDGCGEMGAETVIDDEFETVLEREEDWDGENCQANEAGLVDEVMQVAYETGILDVDAVEPDLEVPANATTVDPKPLSPVKDRDGYIDKIARKPLIPFCAADKSSYLRCINKVKRRSYRNETTPFMNDDFMMDMNDRREGFLICPVHKSRLQRNQHGVLIWHSMFKKYAMNQSPWRGELVVRQGTELVYAGTYQTSDHSFLSPSEFDSLPQMVKDYLYNQVIEEMQIGRWSMHRPDANDIALQVEKGERQYAKITFRLVGYVAGAQDRLVNASRRAHEFEF